MQVKHPLSSIESAALTQLRSELKSLLAKSDTPPDFSLVPLPRPPTHPPLPSAILATPKVARPKPLLRQTTSLLRKSTRRRATADAAVPSRSACGSSKAASALQPLQASVRAAKQKGQLSEKASGRCSTNRAVSSSPGAVSAKAGAGLSSCGPFVSIPSTDHDSSSSLPEMTPATDVAASAHPERPAANAESNVYMPHDAAEVLSIEVLRSPQSSGIGDEVEVLSQARQLINCISWPGGAGLLREGVTQSSIASTSYTSK